MGAALFPCCRCGIILEQPEAPERARRFTLSQLSDVNAFILETRKVSTAAGMCDLLGSVTQAMGFHAFSLVQHVRDFNRENKKFLAVRNVGDNWVDYFLEHKLHSYDPAYIASGRTTVGFRFGDIPSLIKLTARHRSVQEAARREGITDGFCVPAHIPGEANGSCTFVMTNNRPLPSGNLPMAQLVGTFAYEAARRLLRSGVCFVEPPAKPGSDVSPPHASAPRFTTRQLECIVLVARGKTDWEISKILGLHEQTVTQHLNEARRRCGVSRRSELPIQALYHGHLTFTDVLN
jgi:LuxR family transcriptional regulator, quorum-sensing system regulator CciR